MGADFGASRCRRSQGKRACAAFLLNLHEPHALDTPKNAAEQDVCVCVHLIRMLEENASAQAKTSQDKRAF